MLDLAVRKSNGGVWRAVACGLFLTACDARVDPNGFPDVAADHVRPNDASEPGDATNDDVPASVDAAPTDSGVRADAGATDAGPTCRANNDFTLTRDEVPYVIGATVLFATNADATTVAGITTAGTSGAMGQLWDLSATRTEDHRVLQEVLAPAGQWWASQYPTASFALQLDAAGVLYGVYRSGPDRLELLGTVSREANRTSLAMDPAVIVVQFPLTEGATWTQRVTATGLYNFVGFTNVTTYTSRADGHGEVRTPAGRFTSLRLRVDIDQTVPLTTFHRTQRSYTFLSECWGVIARIASVDNEMATEFTSASEYRRLSL